MITDEIMEALDLLMAHFASQAERSGVWKAQMMLSDWSDDDWSNMSLEEKNAFICKYV